MGEAMFYLSADFKGDLKEINEFIKQGQKAYDFWQANRNMDTKKSKFWDEFKNQFPLVYNYLGELADGDCNNSLAGELDFGYNEKAEIKNDKLTFSAEVWHMASWDRFVDFLKNNFGATNVSWHSEEGYE